MGTFINLMFIAAALRTCGNWSVETLLGKMSNCDKIRLSTLTSSAVLNFSGNLHILMALLRVSMSLDASSIRIVSIKPGFSIEIQPKFYQDV